MTDLYQNLLTDLESASTDEERARITLQFNLNTQSERVREAVQAAAILHWFDQSMLNFVLSRPLSDEEFRTVISLPYVEKFPERGWNVHESACKLIRDDLLHSNWGLYRKLSRLAATWCRKYHPSDPIWQIEAVYHSLFAGESMAEKHFIHMGLMLLNSYRQAALESLLRPILIAVEAGKLSAEISAWAWFLKARLDIGFGRYQEAKAALTKTLEIEKENLKLLLLATLSLAEVNLFFDDPRESQRILFSIMPKIVSSKDRLAEANAIYFLARSNESLYDFPDSRRQCIEARAIFRSLGNQVGEANCFFELGIIATRSQDLQEALIQLESANELYKKTGSSQGIANCHMAFGVAYTYLSNFELARQQNESSLKISLENRSSSGEALTIMNMGITATEEGNFDEAISFLEDAEYKLEKLRLPTEQSKCLNAKGNLYLYNARYEEAIASYNSAINIAPQGIYYINLSEPYMALGDFQNAERCLLNSYEAFPDIHYLYFNWGRLNLWQGKAKEALTYFEKALSDRPHWGEFYLWNAVALAITGEHKWTLEFQRGLERTYLNRQKKEVFESLAKLKHTYPDAPIEQVEAFFCIATG